MTEASQQVISLEVAAGLTRSVAGSPPWTRDAVAAVHLLAHGSRGQFERAANLVGQGARAAGYPEVTAAEVDGVLPFLQEDLEGIWFYGALRDLGEHLYGVMVAIARAGEPASVGTVIEELRSSPQVVDNAIRRLVAAGLVDRPGRGEARIAVPGMDEYLRQHPTPAPPPDTEDSLG